MKKYATQFGLSLFVGLLSGVSATVFLMLLQWVTHCRDEHQMIVWALPLAGALIGFVYFHFGGASGRGHNLILDEIHEPKTVVPFRMAPLVLFGTLLTHLFGGSAGREGTAVQMGASLADQLHRFFPLSSQQRKNLLIAGAGSGFGAAIGAPLAGVIFGMEFIATGRLKIFSVVECFVASFVAWGVTLALHAPHTQYPRVMVPAFSLWMFAGIVVAAVIFGLFAAGFIELTHTIENILSHIKYPPLRSLIGGLVLIACYKYGALESYEGLGIPVIQNAIDFPPAVKVPLIKAVLTALTLGSGFKGGEFIPLVFMGTTLGSVMGPWLQIAYPMLAVLGFAAMFAAASNTPIACSLMAAELFGLPILPYALVACYVSYLAAGDHSIYTAQRRPQSKFFWLLWLRNKIKSA